MSESKPARPIVRKKIQVYLKTRPGFLVLTTSPVSMGVLWGYRPSRITDKRKEGRK